jgi:hypothetical protein
VSHTLDVSRVPEMLEQLLSDDRLTKWERNFCESLSAQLDEGYVLSDRQLEVLEQVWCKY